MDGYWVLADALGVHNLSRLSVRDLPRLKGLVSPARTARVVFVYILLREVFFAALAAWLALGITPRVVATTARELVAWAASGSAGWAALRPAGMALFCALTVVGTLLLARRALQPAVLVVRGALRRADPERR